jgi:hypothetical protein
MESETFTNGPRLRMARMDAPRVRETYRRRTVREALERAALTRVSPRHVEAVIQADLGPEAWPTRWQLERLVSSVVTKVEADPTRAEQLAVRFGL